MAGRNITIEKTKMSGGTGEFKESSDENAQTYVEIESDEDDENYHPIEQVRMTVPPTDDPSLPVLTFRTWFLGLISCVLLAFVNQFFAYRQNPVFLSGLAAQIVTLPIGKFMARVLPTTKFRVPLAKWSFTLNPGPFNMKEHVLILLFAGTGASGVYAVGIINIVKAFYHRKMNPVAAWLLAQTTQLLGYGWAGIFRKVLVDSPYMWWPDSMVLVSMFRALHEKEARPKGGVTRLQFFIMIAIASFAYYLVPSYLAPSISSISILCLIYKDKIFPQQLGSGLYGMGIGSFGLDWATVTYVGSPIATPTFAIFNILVGFFLMMYVILPLSYYNNLFDAKKFPLFSSNTYDHNGHTFNISRVLNETSFDLDLAEYRGYSKLYLSVSFAFSYGICFASLTATITHVALYHGKTIWSLWSKAKENLDGKMDVHTRIMKKNYETVPDWWFHVLLLVVFCLSMFNCEGFHGQLQLPWWGLVMACLIALTFTLPIGIIQATTNMQIGLNVITELIIGYIYPGRPLANVTFKTYGYISMAQALDFLGDFKFGLYMKIPPKSMFVGQLVGTMVASTVCFFTSWWLLETVEHICDPSLLPDGSPWTCPGDTVFYHASIIWGVIGPLKMFASQGVYGAMNWWFLVGFLAPLPSYFIGRMYPNKKWIRLINIPLIFSVAGSMPPARSVNYIMWGISGIFFNIYVYKAHNKWWATYGYVLAAALDTGITLMGILLFFTLQSKDIVGPNWWGLAADDHCSLARCPTAPGIHTEGCPVF